FSQASVVVRLTGMQLQKAAAWAQILSLVPGAYCAYAAWVTLHLSVPQSGVPAAGRPPAPFNLRITSVPVNSTAVQIAFGAFVGLIVLGGVLALTSRRERVKSEKAGNIAVATSDRSADLKSPAMNIV